MIGKWHPTGFSVAAVILSQANVDDGIFRIESGQESQRLYADIPVGVTATNIFETKSRTHHDR